MILAYSWSCVAIITVTCWTFYHTPPQMWYHQQSLLISSTIILNYHPERTHYLKNCPSSSQDGSSCRSDWCQFLAPMQHFFFYPSSWIHYCQIFYIYVWCCSKNKICILFHTIAFCISQEKSEKKRMQLYCLLWFPGKLIPNLSIDGR